MSDNRVIPLVELNKMIDEKVKEYNEQAGENYRASDNEEFDRATAKAEALEDLKIDINDPQAFENVSENIQQTINVVDTKKIIDNGL